MTGIGQRRQWVAAGRFWVALLCLLVVLVMAVQVSGGAGCDWAPFLLVAVFLFALVDPGLRLLSGGELERAPVRLVLRAALFERPPPQLL